MTAQGVPYSRAIFAASGVVIKATPVRHSRHCERSEAIHRSALRTDGWIASSLRSSQ
jgi:hypothetical protein